MKSRTWLVTLFLQLPVRTRSWAELKSLKWWSMLRIKEKRWNLTLCKTWIPKWLDWRQKPTLKLAKSATPLQFLWSCQQTFQISDCKTWFKWSRKRAHHWKSFQSTTAQNNSTIQKILGNHCSKNQFWNCVQLMKSIWLLQIKIPWKKYALCGWFMMKAWLKQKFKMNNSFSWRKRLNKRKFLKKKMSKMEHLRQTMMMLLSLTTKKTVQNWKLSKWGKILKQANPSMIQLIQILSHSQVLMKRKNSQLRFLSSQMKSRSQWLKFRSKSRRKVWKEEWMKMRLRRDWFLQWQRRRTVQTRSRRKWSKMMRNEFLRKSSHFHKTSKSCVLFYF